jgi:hypothetical protein
VPDALGLDNNTLLQALSFGGGSDLTGAAKILLRAAVAALLNAAHPNIDYPRTAAQIIADVNAALASGNRNTILALASQLDKDNNLGCPINGKEGVQSGQGLALQGSEASILYFQFIPSITR